jgi:hypothetical protein
MKRYYAIGDVEKYTFETFEELEKYFIEEVLTRKGVSSKVIGKTLLIWEEA